MVTSNASETHSSAEREKTSSVMNPGKLTKSGKRWIVYSTFDQFNNKSIVLEFAWFFKWGKPSSFVFFVWNTSVRAV